MKILALVGLAACSLLADTYPRQPGIDVEHYIFRVTLADNTDQISGETTVAIRFVQAGVRQVSLDLGQLMTVAAVALDGAPVQFRHEGDRLAIPLPSAPAPGELRRFTVQYHGAPSGGLKILKNK